MAKKSNTTTGNRNYLSRNDGRSYSVPAMSRYGDVKMACYATGRRAKEIRDYVHVVLCRAGGFNATARLTNEWAESGMPRKIRVPLKPKKLRRVLERLDDLCASGQLEIRVHGERFD